MIFQKRRIMVYVALVLALMLLGARVFHLHISNQSFLESEGNKRSVRHEVLAAPRGRILDRHGKPLAITAPVKSIYIDPKVFRFTLQSDAVLLALGVNAIQLKKNIQSKPRSRFMYLKRHVSPQVARRVRELDAPGVFSLTEYRRFYPDADALGPLLGITNVDGKGVAGLELQFNQHLTDKKGLKHYQKDVKGNTIKVFKEQKAVPGKDLTLSIDRHIQQAVYRALVKGASKNGAASASAVVLDVKTGEVLAMANYPSFNPNNPKSITKHNHKNRALTDTFEPGSTMKPIAVAASLKDDKITPQTKVIADGGVLRIGRRQVRDPYDYSEMDVAFIVKKSSNVGVSKLVLDAEPTLLPDTLKSLKFGQKSGVEFPGDAKGVLPAKRHLKPFALATLAFGYGMAANNLQIAQAYAVLARKGQHITPTLLKREAEAIAEPVLKPYIAESLLRMLEGVVENGGTGVRAQIKGYRIAGKTGTSRKAGKGGYELDKYVATFAGIAPADNPQYVMVVIVDDPRGDRYHGGSVAAPIFQQSMKKILSLKF